MKKYGILLILLSFSSLMSYYFWKNNKISDRSPSSISVDKTLIISTIQWRMGKTESELEMELNCDDWFSMEVTLKAEGMAYSGEPSRMVQTSLCGEHQEGFYQLWPHDLMQNHKGIQKIGLYDEAPPEWTLEKIKFFGSLGAVEVSAVEIYHHSGEIFIFEAY